MEKVDITLDFTLIEYLKNKIIPDEYENSEREDLIARA